MGIFEDSLLLETVLPILNTVLHFFAITEDICMKIGWLFLNIHLLLLLVACLETECQWSPKPVAVGEINGSGMGRGGLEEHNGTEGTCQRETRKESSKFEYFMFCTYLHTDMITHLIQKSLLVQKLLSSGGQSQPNREGYKKKISRLSYLSYIFCLQQVMAQDSLSQG